MPNGIQPSQQPRTRSRFRRVQRYCAAALVFAENSSPSAAAINSFASNTFPIEYICWNHRTTGTYEQYVWINYTTYLGQHVTIDAASRPVSLMGC